MNDHGVAVSDLRARFARLPPDAPVRLGKSTSNLFRFGTGVAGARRLDVGGLNRVLHVDTAAGTADVQGMTTYEHVVDATLQHGLMPLVVPQLKTITLGGAVSGLGIESTSFRHGLPHESVLEMDILTGDGRVVTATPDGEHADLFRGFPNSYGSLGYALRLRIELQPVRRYVRLQHQRFDDADKCAAAIDEIVGSPAPPDFLDGVVFGPDELYLTVAEFVDTLPPGAQTSDYTGQRIFYRSIPQRDVDFLTARDYLWRWDTDWFWCSAVFGVQHPLIRPLWPKRYRRSDVYRRLVASYQKYRHARPAMTALGRPRDEYVVQDVEIPVDRLGEFLDVYHREIRIRPAWLCPLRLRDTEQWPLYPLEPGRRYVNIGFWGGTPLEPEQPPDRNNRLIEELVADLGGHKSLYSSVHYSREEFWRRYNGEAYHALKRRYDPDGRLPDLYDKCTAG